MASYSELPERLATEWRLLQPLLPVYSQLIASAVVLIYTGAHASLSRPSSAAKPEKHSDAGSDDESETDEEPKMEGLQPSDAVWFPLLAGLTLGGLYLLIKWLEDLALLNKLLNWYFSSLGVVAVGRLLGDGLNIIVSFLFPATWSDGHFLWHVDHNQWLARALSHQSFSSEHDQPKKTPLPGLASRIPLPVGFTRFLWRLKCLTTERWRLVVKMHGNRLLRLVFGVSDIAGLIMGFCAVVAYQLTSRPWWLMNVIGCGFTYGSLQIMSPTTFWTGTMVLGTLLCYDIYFVFFTPLMVTVALSLDVPIKLLFPRPTRSNQDPSKQDMALLGLGDIILPGIMICLALRFDLYQCYAHKQIRPTSDEGTSLKPDSPGELVAEAARPVKAVYLPATGQWGERFWSSNHPDSTLLAGKSFPKPYFHAGIAGYVSGLLTTLGVMQFSGHAQPALLYLVPAVLFSLWCTAVLRGEIKDMWQYSESPDETKTTETHVNTKNDTHRTQLSGSSSKKQGASKEICSMVLTSLSPSTSFPEGSTRTDSPT